MSVFPILVYFYVKTASPAWKKWPPFPQQPPFKNCDWSPNPPSLQQRKGCTVPGDIIIGTFWWFWVPSLRKIVESVWFKFFTERYGCIEGILSQTPQSFQLLWSWNNINEGHNYWDISPTGCISVYRSPHLHYKAISSTDVPNMETWGYIDP